MRIYMFYFKDENYSRSLEPVLYAFTNNKQFADRFKDFRNMNKFRIVEREITKPQYKDVTRQYPGKQLVETLLTTKDSQFPTIKNKIAVICTWDEEKAIILQSEDSVFELFKDYMFNPSILNMDIKVDLFKMGFFTIYQYLYQNMYIYEPLEGSEYTGIFFKDSFAGDLNRPIPNMQNIRADQFEMFLYLYGGTVK